MIIIGMNGRKGSGKDTAGQYLVERYGFTRIAFADKLKQSAAAIWGIDPALWDELKNDPNAYVEIRSGNNKIVSVPVRGFLQRYGTEAHRDIFGEFFWVDAVLDDLAEPEVGYVVTDARFPSELLGIKEKQGLNIQIIRPGTDDGDAHASEAEPPLELIHERVINDGTVEEFQRRITESLQWLGVAVSPKHDIKETT